MVHLCSVKLGEDGHTNTNAYAAWSGCTWIFLNRTDLSRSSVSGLYQRTHLLGWRWIRNHFHPKRGVQT